MLLRKSAYEDEDVRGYIQGMTSDLIQGTGLTSLAIQRQALNAGQFWHNTRLAEYPWVFNAVEPRGAILDIGTNPQATVHLLYRLAKDGVAKPGFERLVSHHTHQDTRVLGVVPVGPFGWNSMDPVYKLHAKHHQIVFGYPNDLPLQPESFDMIYNVSVMEHVPSPHAKEWAFGIWRFLKPGGCIVMTCDHLVEHPAGYRYEGHECTHIENHPWWDWIQEWGATIEAAEPADLPWHPEFDESIWMDPDVWKEPYPVAEGVQAPLYGVYGLVLRKP